MSDAENARDFKLNSRPEQYLNDPNNYGNITKYYNYLAEGRSFSTAFAWSVSKVDKVRLRQAGYFEDLIESREGIGAPDNDCIERALNFLEETRSEYPEGHPIWQIR